MEPKKRQRHVKVGAMSYALMVRLMLDGELSIRELAEQTGLHSVTVGQYTREMHRAGACYICAWQQDRRDRDTIRIYKIGVGKDAKRRKLSDRERQRRHREAKAGRIASVFLLGAAQARVRGPLGFEDAAPGPQGIPSVSGEG